MILVTGANGNVGSDVVSQLVRAGARVRALVRTQSRSGLPAGVEAVTGDLNEPASLSAALRGVRGVFLLGGYQDMPGVLAEMRRASVEQVVLLTSRSSVGGSPSNAIAHMWMVSEAAVKSSGVPWTLLQPSGFMSNALRWLPQLRAGNVIRVPFADVPIAAIDPHDIAAVATTVLTSKGHESRSYMLTGPEAILPAAQVDVLSRVLGRPLRLEGLSEAETREELSGSFPPDFVEAFFRFFAKGEFDDSPVLPTVQELTGRWPRTFEQWAGEHAALFR